MLRETCGFGALLSIIALLRSITRHACDIAIHPGIRYETNVLRPRRLCYVQNAPNYGESRFVEVTVYSLVRVDSVRTAAGTFVICLAGDRCLSLFICHSFWCCCWFPAFLPLYRYYCCMRVRTSRCICQGSQGDDTRTIFAPLPLLALSAMGVGTCFCDRSHVVAFGEVSNEFGVGSTTAAAIRRTRSISTRTMASTALLVYALFACSLA